MKLFGKYIKDKCKIFIRKQKLLRVVKEYMCKLKNISGYV